ncbi:ATP-binding protein [Gallaecimonas pentaromativorans]|uniref:ATP-binding protein n=1 Tax=Gallaecimonas pentaromativorans TaxID=584787 RepID=UPI003A91D224
MHRSYLFGTAAGLSLLTLGFIQTAAATPSTTQEAAESHWGLGIGASSKQKAYKDIDRKNRVLPLVSYENRYIQLQGPELAINLPELGPEGNSLLKNLLENAIEHAPPHSQVQVALLPHELSVRDWGAGVDESQLPHLFERFWRGAHRRDRGAGLGLAICQEIALAHGWHLAASRQEPGLLITLTVA